MEIDCSSGNIGDKGMPQPLFWGMDKFVNTIQAAGYRGAEWFPLRSRAGLQLRKNNLSQKAKDSVVSLHQSFRSEKTFKEALAHPNRALAVLSYFLLPERVTSLNDLEQIKQAIGRNVPAVLYPENKGEASGTQRDFAQKLFQPTPGVMRQWEVSSMKGLIHQTFQRGYTGLCLDLYHFRKPDQVDLNPWQRTLPILSPYIEEIHVSAGRGDMMQDFVDTNAELRDLLNGTEKTDLPRILKTLSEFGWKGRVVTEIPAASLKLVLGSRPAFLKPDNFIQAHQQIVGNIQRFLS